MVILALGSNLSSSFGDRFENIELALAYLDSYNIKIIKKSSFFETPSFPNHKNPKFINIVIEVFTSLPPVDLASVLIYVEEKLERKRINKNDPRTCDIDIIDYNRKNIEFTYNNLKFVVPHESLGSRNFVLFPLKEISSNWIHPKTNESIDTLIENLPDDDKKSILKVKKP